MEEELATLERETRSSIEVDRNAKGEYSLKVKIYFDETNDPTARVATQKKLQAVDEWFRFNFTQQA